MRRIGAKGIGMAGGDQRARLRHGDTVLPLLDLTARPCLR